MIADAADALRGVLETYGVYAVLLPVFVGLVGGERLVYAVRGMSGWDDRDARANIVITGAFLGLEALVGALVPLGLFALLHHALSPWTLGLGVAGWGIAFVLHDLGWYVDHRIAHRTGLFWAFHHVHHSSEQYNTTVASRGFLLDATLLTRPTFFGLALLGVTPVHLVVVTAITNIWGIAQHTRLVGKLGWLDRVLATPSSHRVHHGSDAAYLDRNYGEVLMIWDHLFGTYTPEDDEPTYGVTVPIGTTNVVAIELAGVRWLAAKVRAADGWANKVACLVRPPEWVPPAPVVVDAPVTPRA